MIRTLAADHPHPSLAAQSRVFDHFVGTWNAQYTHFAADGAVLEQYTGRVLFGWILGGRAMQDIWIGDPVGERSEASMGTSIRFFDTSIGVWRVIWIAPEEGVVVTVQGGLVGDRIVLEGDNSDGSRRRWSFNEIRDDSFVWRGERSDDGGATWSRTAEYQMRRDHSGDDPVRPA
jgi:hypothetical protein